MVTRWLLVCYSWLPVEAQAYDIEKNLNNWKISKTKITQHRNSQSYSRSTPINTISQKQRGQDGKTTWTSFGML